MLKLKNLELLKLKIRTENKVDVVIGRSGEMRIMDKNTRILHLTTHNIPYGSNLYVKNGERLKKEI